jgi:hypothetical protein
MNRNAIPKSNFCLVNDAGRWACITFRCNNLSKAGWSWGCGSAVDSDGRTIWIADAHRGDGKRFVVRANEILTAFVDLESAIRTCPEFGLTDWPDCPKLHVAKGF